MRVLLCNKFYYRRGGDCIHTIDLQRLLESHGHEVAVFAMNHADNLKSQYAEYWPSEVSFTSKRPVSLVKAFLRPFGTGEVQGKFKALLGQFRPDIVHLHNIHSQLSPVIAELAKQQGIPVVWTMHDYKLMCPAYTFMDNRGDVCEACLKSPVSVIRKRCIKGSLPASLLGYAEGRFWNPKRLLSCADIFVAPSAFMKKKMEQAGFPESRIRHIYNFASQDKFSSSVRDHRDRTVVFLGRLSPEKGVGSLCAAFKGITSDAVLQVFGDGPLREELESEYASDSIQFLGFQPWEKIKSSLGSASFMVIPSEWYENNPLSIIESLALGTPVLGAAIGGIPELIQDGLNGMTYQEGNSKALTEALSEMLEEGDWHYSLVQAEAKERFSALRYYDKIIQVYSGLIS